MVAYDAGGLRMLDVSDKYAPVEISKYVNWDLEYVAQSAYNNVLIVDHYAYVTLDYCGMEVVDIATAAMENKYWFNPWDCDTLNWNGRPGHTNGIAHEEYSDVLFVSGGDSELLIFDILARTEPRLVGSYAHVGDSIVAWSLDVWGNNVMLALVNNEAFGVPYYSNIGGIMSLALAFDYEIGIDEPYTENGYYIYPNPANDQLHISGDITQCSYCLHALDGRTIFSGICAESISCSDLPTGLFLLEIRNNSGNIVYAGSFVHL